MVFLGYDFCSDGDSMKSNPMPLRTITSTKIQNGIYDDLYITKNTELQNVPSEWTYDTILHAMFNGTLSGGNLDYTLEQVSALRVKRRKKPASKMSIINDTEEYDWMTLYEIPVNSYDDFQFVKYDSYADGNSLYEYAIVPLLGNVEGALNTSVVQSEFDGVIICNNERNYHTVADVMLNTHSREFSVSVLKPLNQKYPYIINNGDSNYDKGNCSAFFVDTDYMTCKLNLDDQIRYQREFVDFLTDGNTKFLKTGDGRAWIISVTGNPSSTNAEHVNKWVTSFEWTESGDKNSSTDMYNAGLIDVNVEGS